MNNGNLENIPNNMAIVFFNLTYIDIRRAYLQAHVKARTCLYTRMHPAWIPSHDAHDNKLNVKLRKNLYGQLRVAGLESGHFLSKFLLRCGFRGSTLDACLYAYRKGHEKESLFSTISAFRSVVDNRPALRSVDVVALNKTFQVDDKGIRDWILQVRV